MDAYGRLAEFGYSHEPEANESGPEIQKDKIGKHCIYQT